MRIVHVIPSLGPGGAEQVLCDLVAWQTKAGHDVRLLTTRPSESPGSIDEELRDSIVIIGGSGRHSSHLQAALWTVLHREAFFRADVLHVHLSAGSMIGYLVEVLRDVAGSASPVVVETDHSAGVAISKGQHLLYSATRRQRRELVSVIRGSLSTQPREVTRCWEIPNGIAPLPVRSSWGAHSPFRIGSLGLLRPDRLPDLYLDVVEAVLARRDVVFVYGGDGSYRGALQQAIDGRGLSQVVSIQGLVTDKVRFFVDIDVHLSIAVGADVGLASLEAASSGTPSLAIQLRNDHPGLGDAIPSSRDPDELANLLVALIDSEQERKELGKQQAQYVRSERSIDSMGQSYMEVYREALAAADPASP